MLQIHAEVTQAFRVAFGTLWLVIVHVTSPEGAVTVKGLSPRSKEDATLWATRKAIRRLGHRVARVSGDITGMVIA